MSATLADLVSQPHDDIDSINNSIQSAEAQLAAAPADICIPASCLENFGVLFERRYEQTKEPNDLQAAITWAELCAAAIPQDNLVQENCYSKVVGYLDSNHKQRVNSEVSPKPREQSNSVIPETPNKFLAVNVKRSLDCLDSTSGSTKRVKAGTETTSLTSISATLPDLVSQLNSDIDSLNNAIRAAEAVLADTPDDTCIPADCYKNLGVLLERRYQQTNDLDDLQGAITWAKTGVAAIPPGVSRVLCLSNLITYLLSRYQQTGELDDLCEARKRQQEVTLENLPLSSNNILNILNPEASKCLNDAYDKSPLASLDSSSIPPSEVASEDSDDPNYLDNAIFLAETALAEASQVTPRKQNVSTILVLC